MTIYSLRNGLSIDLKFEKPELFQARPAFFEFDNTKPLYQSTVNAHPLPIDDSGNIIPHRSSVIKMRAAGTLSGATPDVFNKCSLRFIQVIKVRSFELSYFGKRQNEGAVQWQFSNRLLQRNIDSKLNADGTTSAPFQFDETQTDRIAPNTLVARMGDGPGAGMPLAARNTSRDCDNYLRFFFDNRQFETIATFVHPDNSLQMLESWKWKMSRAVAVKWVGLRPEIDRTNSIHFTMDPALVSVFGKDSDFSETMSSNRIANRLTNEALADVRQSPDINFQEITTPEIFPSDGFWIP